MSSQRSKWIDSTICRISAFTASSGTSNSRSPLRAEPIIRRTPSTSRIQRPLQLERETVDSDLHRPASTRGASRGSHRPSRLRFSVIRSSADPRHRSRDRRSWTRGAARSCRRSRDSSGSSITSNRTLAQSASSDVPTRRVGRSRHATRFNSSPRQDGPAQSNSWSSRRGRSSRDAGMDPRAGTCPPASHRESRRASRRRGIVGRHDPAIHDHGRPRVEGHVQLEAPPGRSLSWFRWRRRTGSRHPIRSHSDHSDLKPAAAQQGGSSIAPGRHPFGRCADPSATLVCAGPFVSRVEQACCRSRIASRARRRDRHR